MDTQTQPTILSTSSTLAPWPADRAFAWIVTAILRSEIAPRDRRKEARIARRTGLIDDYSDEGMDKTTARIVADILARMVS